MLILLANLSLIQSNLEVPTLPPQHDIEKSLFDHYMLSLSIDSNMI